MKYESKQFYVNSHLFLIRVTWSENNMVSGVTGHWDRDRPPVIYRTHTQSGERYENTVSASSEKDRCAPLQQNSAPSLVFYSHHYSSKDVFHSDDHLSNVLQMMHTHIYTFASVEKNW